jgi:hypothetical protein
MGISWWAPMTVKMRRTAVTASRSSVPVSLRLTKRAATEAQIGKEPGISQMHVSRVLDRALTYLRHKSRKQAGQTTCKRYTRGAAGEPSGWANPARFWRRAEIQRSVHASGSLQYHRMSSHAAPPSASIWLLYWRMPHIQQ